MKKYILIFVIALVTFTQAQVTQQWAARYNGPGNLGDGASSTAIDDSGNVYTTGYSLGSGTGDDYSTIKYNSGGIQQWVSRYNGPGSSTDAANQIAVDASGNVYVTGYSRSGSTAGTEDFATIKYNSAGVQQWVTRYNGSGNSFDVANQIAVDNIGNVYITGSSTGSGTDYDYVTIKHNSSGVQQWVQRYNGPGNSLDEAYRIAVSDSGNVYVTGYSRSGSTAGTEDFATIKYNSSGVQQWIQRYNNGANDAAYSIAVDGLGNVYVAGFAWNGFSFLDFLVIKYNSAGVQKWLQIYVAPSTGIAYSLAVDASGNVYVAGGSWGSSGNLDYATVKLDSLGSPLWTKFYNGPGNSDDEAYSLDLDGLGNVYVTGYSRSGSTTGTEDFATIKYNPAGVEEWIQRYNGPGSGSDKSYSLKVDGSMNVYVAGISAGSSTGNDFATIKYSQSVGIEPISIELPEEYVLSQNYPNPFNPVTNINFNIPKAGMVKMVVYDALGKKVSELVNGQFNAGSYKVDFNASSLASGVYFYKLETEGFTDVKKMMLIK